MGLPTYILFENNSEIARFPGVDFVAKGFHPPITKVHAYVLSKSDKWLITDNYDRTLLIYKVPETPWFISFESALT